MKKKLQFFINSGGVTYDTDYQAVLSRGTSLGYTLPSVAQRAKQSALVTALKAAGVWTLIDILYIYATDGDSDYATLNWKTPSSFQCLKVVSPIFTSNSGYAGVIASSSYLNTQWVPKTSGVNFTLNEGGFGCYVNSNIGNSTRQDMGAQNSTAIMDIISRNGADNFTSRINGNTNITIANASGVGFYHRKRTASNATSAFKNGSSIGSDSSAVVDRSTAALAICALNNNGTPQNFSDRIVSMAWAGTSLDTRESAFYTAWNTYFTSL